MDTKTFNENVAINEFANPIQEPHFIPKGFKRMPPEYNNDIGKGIEVLEKIRGLNPNTGKLWFEYSISYCHCRIWSNTALEFKHNAGTTAHAVQQSLSEFIQWYNTQII